MHATTFNREKRQKRRGHPCRRLREPLVKNPYGGLGNSQQENGMLVSLHLRTFVLALIGFNEVFLVGPNHSRTWGTVEDWDCTSEDKGKAGKDAERDGTQSVAPANVDGDGAGIAVGGRVRRGRAAEAGEDLVLGGGAGGAVRGRGRRGHGRDGRGVGRGRVLGPARPILAAGARAGVVAAARRDALVVGLGADVVRDRLGILGCVGRHAVAADATVHERGLVSTCQLGWFRVSWARWGVDAYRETLVLAERGRLAGHLRAQQGAGPLLVVAPGVCDALAVSTGNAGQFCRRCRTSQGSGHRLGVDALGNGHHGQARQGEGHQQGDGMHCAVWTDALEVMSVGDR